MPNSAKKPGSPKRRKASKPKASTSDASDRLSGSIDDAMCEQDAIAALQASDKLYYRIGEVSKLTGVKAHVLRYWETEFRWMTPPKSRSKQRLYRQRDIEFVWLLKRLLWNERYTIAGARQRIQDLGVEDALALLQQPNNGTAANQAEAPRADWMSLRNALDEMRVDLISLRGVLQEPA